MDTERVASALGRLKLFPLPEAVLLPGAPLALHVFEPRYRALAREAANSDRVIAVGMLAPGWEDDYQGRPSVHPIIGVGVIKHADRMPDGRFNVILRGVARARILTEHPPEKSFREVLAEPIADVPATDPQPAEAVRQFVLDLCHELPPDVSAALAAAVARELDPGRLCDLAAAALIPSAAGRQAVLEAIDVDRRLSLVIGELGEYLLRVRAQRSGHQLMA